MIKNTKTYLKTAGVLAPLSALAIAALPLQVTAGTKGYVTSAPGTVVKNPYGECWTSVGGMKAMLPECGDVVAKPMMDAKDSDGDGVPDDKDKCPGTPKGAPVDASGCPLDSDGDGVPDYRDKCPGTPPGVKVNEDGCEIIASVTIDLVSDEFDFDSAKLKPAMMSALDDVAAKVKASRGDESLHIVGHTDSVGPESYNQGLSERRAQSAADYLAGQGIDANRITTEGRGESSPVADNSTDAGRAKNRRVEIRTK